MTEASFNWPGFWSAMASNLTNQSHNVLSKKFMVKKENWVINLLRNLFVPKELSNSFLELILQLQFLSMQESLDNIVV
ncbi:hypothetical protein BUALT_Bualt06G0070300 [Buddleja alternifolia]|uniref:Sugar phosphate transporter domain-containing protein n=1 Tax=Buddleja alternifolia TaxID=168488 RepID=A0AAV6XPI2_9LAMI|nr:hypothetical protein BUALT_Bualt06G0070300 [Buddleja alternifolia]